MITGPPPPPVCCNYKKMIIQIKKNDKKNLFEPSMQIYLPPESQVGGHSCRTSYSRTSATTAVDSAAVAAPEITAAELGGSVNAQPGGGSWILSRVDSK
jgi:hypothetical protein